MSIIPTIRITETMAATADALVDDLLIAHDAGHELTAAERAFLASWHGSWERDETDAADDRRDDLEER